MNSMQQEVSNPRMQAESLKRMGRGPDTQLIHMTDSEIGALNGLSGLVFNEPLRTNPETGLPEAGMFKRLLPTILAIGAATFMGPAAASFLGPTAAGGLGLSTGLATGLGTGLAAFGGHLAGQGLSGQELNIGSAALAGAGSGLMAGFGAAGDATAATTNASNVANTATYNPVSGVMSDPYHMIGPGATTPAAAASLSIPSNPSMYAPSPTFSIDTVGGINEAGKLAQANLSKFAPSPGDLIRSPTEAFNYLAESPGKRLGLPLGMAALSGELDEPLPEAPSGPSRTPFTPKDFDFTRSRRDIDLDEDGKVSQEEIAQVVQGLPEGQSSRFFTPGVFTEAAKEGGLLRLQTGGNIQEAIGALTGGAGASMLPMIAQSVVKPEDEEEESISKGYPVGVAGTPPGAATTGIPVGGGQPPQPFQEGGPMTGEGSVPYFEGRVMPTGNMTEDGMSDNIPFVIAGRQEGGQMGMQPAVLSPDEYVIPADVVSMLGNGSSNAGANDLDQFINNFRMDKYGRPNQPPEMSGGLSSLA